MATLLLTYNPRATAIIANLGRVSETCDRVARVEVRPGMVEGQFQALAMRRWGNGHWCQTNGQPSFYTSREAAIEAANRWIETGRDQ